ncbi:hypothetical protein AWM70_01970 [Paenibacillus yonginensis]|uniref:Sigma-54 factor interaction domain-containing protein n=1 Tax=Paenibacillus yonginensis TaxID=1462996 RepID=A0A1B1MWE4_9BACL|nr:sigma-54-dependent transcriptional regulator [Paenibacillus yonginensis]ANS73501.1 hypothetical protein AWM70_01970 [Paenibacillus yonginensis]
MTIKTLFVAPYEAMVNLIEECGKEESELDLHVQVGNLQHGVALAKQAEAQGFEAIISRGGTAKLIAEAVDIPVIDVHVSGYDMLRVLTLANDFPRKKAIVGFSSITQGAKAITDLLDIPIDMYTIESEDETEELLKRLKQEGYQLIMGDVVTFETASRLGLLGILIQSGREAIFSAFKETKTVSRWMLKSRLEIERLKKILRVTASDFMVVSEQGEVVYEQWKELETGPWAELPLEADLPGTGSGREMTHTTDADGNTLKVTRTRITVAGSVFVVCEFARLHGTRAAEAHESLKIGLPAPPLVIHQSEAMNACLVLIRRCLSYNHFILTGPAGAESELIARYIHFHKFQGNGLYASVKASDLLGLEPETLDGDIKTIYVHTLLSLGSGKKDKLWGQLELFKRQGMTVVLPVMEEEAEWGNRIYGDGVIRIHLPALAQRKEDLKELVTAFLLHFNQTLGTSAVRIHEQALSLLAGYAWPGDVEELKALLQEAVLMEKGYVLEARLIEELLARKGALPAGLRSDLLTGSLEHIEKKIIEKVLEEEGFNQTKAAKRLDINRSTLWRKLKG